MGQDLSRAACVMAGRRTRQACFREWVVMDNPSRDGTRASYSEYDATGELSQHVARYWDFSVSADATPYVHQVLPDGCMSVIASRRNNGRAVMSLQGPRLETRWFDVGPGDEFRGARFWPDAGAQFINLSAASLRDTLVPAADLFGPGCEEVAEELLRLRTPGKIAGAWERFLSARRPLSSIDPTVRTVVMAITASRGAAPLSELATAVHLSDRQLQRRFSRATGLTMKQYARIRRLRASIVQFVASRRLSWSEVAAENGFADQAHLIREFWALAGELPRDVARRVRQISLEGVRP